MMPMEPNGILEIYKKDIFNMISLNKTDEEIQECFSNVFEGVHVLNSQEYLEIPNSVKRACLEFAELGFMSGYKFAVRLAEINERLSKND